MLDIHPLKLQLRPQEKKEKTTRTGEDGGRSFNPLLALKFSYAKIIFLI